MNLSTRDRLLQSAAQLFAAQGYRGASVRDICDLARANPGAVSYHFGGKRQLYRTVLRQAAERLAEAASAVQADAANRPPDVERMVRAVFQRVLEQPIATRLLLRDLADDGTVAVEALEPPLRVAIEGLVTLSGLTDAPRRHVAVESLFVELAALFVLLTVGWPVISRVLDADGDDRLTLFDDLLRRTLDRRH